MYLLQNTLKFVYDKVHLKHVQGDVVPGVVVPALRVIGQRSRPEQILKYWLLHASLSIVYVFQKYVNE